MSKDFNVSFLRPMIIKDVSLIDSLCMKYKSSFISKILLNLHTFLVYLTVKLWICKVRKHVDDLFLHKEAKKIAEYARDHLEYTLEQIEHANCNKFALNNIHKSLIDLDDYIENMEIFLDDDIHKLAKRISSYVDDSRGKNN